MLKSKNGFLLTIFVLYSIIGFVVFVIIEYNKIRNLELNPTETTEKLSYKIICLGNHQYYRGIRSDAMALVVNDNGMPMRCIRLIHDK